MNLTQTSRSRLVDGLVEAVAGLATPPTGVAPSVPPCLRASGRSAFTLTELLVVIGIIMLVAISAVPSFNYLTGSRSVEAGQNAVAAGLSRARQQALYEGKPVGLAIWPDNITGRFTLGLVAYVDPYHQVDASHSGGNYDIDVLADQDFQTLQPGIGASAIVNSTTVTSSPATPVTILFDSNGQLISRPYTITAASTLGTRSGLTVTAADGLLSQINLILYDLKVYEAKTTTADKAAYLKENGLYLVINRYNGTFLANQQ